MNIIKVNMINQEMTQFSALKSNQTIVSDLQVLEIKTTWTMHTKMANTVSTMFQ
jgi:hypothetical protein